MNMDIDLAEQVRRVRNAASNAAVYIIQAPLLFDESDGYPTVILDSEGFVRALDKLHPRALYILEAQFDAATSIREQFESDDDGNEEDLSIDQNSNSAEFSAIVEKWEKHNGELYHYMTWFVIENVIHICIATNNWFHVFEDEVDRFGKEIESRETERQQLANAIAKNKIEEKARELASHPRFNAPRVSHAKRWYLARQIFPQIDESSLHAIVDEAENYSWLNSKLPGRV